MTGRVFLQLLPALMLPALAAGCASADTKRDYSKFETEVQGLQIYSPNFRSDPYLQAEWDALVRALAAECARTGRYCAEAKNARAALQTLPKAGQSR